MIAFEFTVCVLSACGAALLITKRDNGPARFVRERLLTWARRRAQWVPDLLACPVCCSVWTGSVAGVLGGIASGSCWALCAPLVAPFVMTWLAGSGHAGQAKAGGCKGGCSGSKAPTPKR